MSVLLIFTDKNEYFTLEEAAEFLSEARVSNEFKGVIFVSPWLPKAGEGYLYQPDSNRYDSAFLTVNICMIMHSEIHHQ